MTLQSSGSISLADIQTEFGGSNPISLNEYYKGGAYVSSSATAPNIPASGSISLSNFYSSAATIPWTPSQISPTLWAKADAITWSGTSFSSWATSEGSNRTITNSGGTKGSAANGISSLRITGSASYASLSMPQVIPASGYLTAIFFFSIITKSSNANGILNAGGWDGSNAQLGMYVDSSSSNPPAIGNGYNTLSPETAFSATSFATGVWRSVVVQLGPAQLNRVEAASVTLTTDSQATTPTYAAGTWYLGNVSLFGEQLNGDLLEVIVFNKILSTANITNCEGYLYWKYGQQALLPTGHPYKNSAPTVGATVLQALTLSNTTATQNVAWSSTINNTTSGSTITATNTTNSQSLTVSGTTVSGTFTTSGTKSISLVETLSGATGSPKTTIISVSVTSNFVTNGTFDTNTTGWTFHSYNINTSTQTTDNGIASIVSGRLRLTCLDATTRTYPTATIALTGLTIGQTYTLSGNYYINSTYGCHFFIDSIVNVGLTSGTFLSTTFVANATTMFLTLEADEQAVGEYVEFDNIFVG
jgi:hypothetical protein